MQQDINSNRGNICWKGSKEQNQWIEHHKASNMPQVKAMYTCICWNIGTTSQDIRDWMLGGMSYSDKIFIKNVTYFTFIRKSDKVLGDLSGHGWGGDSWLFTRTSMDYHSSQMKMRRSEMA